MARRRYLIAYDIADDKRLRRIAKMMEGYGDRLQYSVFLCDLTVAECMAWRADLAGIMELREDSVVSIDLGVPEKVVLEIHGRSRRLPRTGPVII